MPDITIFTTRAGESRPTSRSLSSHFGTAFLEQVGTVEIRHLDTNVREKQRNSSLRLTRWNCNNGMHDRKPMYLMDGMKWDFRISTQSVFTVRRVGSWMGGNGAKSFRLVLYNRDQFFHFCLGRHEVGYLILIKHVYFVSSCSSSWYWWACCTEPALSMMVL